jgi:hypothetical protein
MSTLDDVRSLDLAVLPDWLSIKQPEAGAERTNWWLAIIEGLTGEISAPGEVSYDLVERLVSVIEMAVAESALSEAETATRLGYLAATIAARAPRWIAPEALRPDVAVRRLIDQISLDPDRAADLAVHWEDRPLAVIRNLRAAKNLLGPVQLLQKRLTDERLAREAQAWLRVLPSLP